MYITREYETEAKRLRIPRCIFGAPITLASGRVLTCDGRPLDAGERDEQRADEQDQEQAELDAQRARDVEFLRRRREQAPEPPKPQPPRPGGAGARIVAAAKANGAPVTPQEQARLDLEAIRLSRGAVQRQADAAVERARRIAAEPLPPGARIVQAARTTKGAA